MSDVLDTHKVAALVGLSGSTLRKLRMTGDGPRFLKLGRAVRYRRCDVEAWLADRYLKSTSEIAGAGAGSRQ